MSEEFLFFNYLLEKYASYKGIPAPEVLKLWDSKGITDEIYEGYFQYHQERIENAYDDIDHLIAFGEHLA